MIQRNAADGLKVGIEDGDKFLYKPAPCSLFPLEQTDKDEWYVRQHGYKGEKWDLFCIAPNFSAVPATAFDLPYKGTRVLVATPSADVCWRRQLADGQWTEWNRAFTGSGQFVDVRL